MPRHYTMKRTGTVWTSEEDITLLSQLQQGTSLKDIAKLHQRSLGSIITRLSKRNYQSHVQEHIPSPLDVLESKNDPIVDELNPIVEPEVEWKPVIQLPPSTGELICVFDTETTGLPAFESYTSTSYPRIVQCAYELYTNEGVMVEKGCHILYPDDYTIPDEAAAIHHITTDRAKREGIPFSDWVVLWKSVVQRAHTMVAHNMNFDDNMIQSELFRHGQTNLLLQWKGIRKQCTLAMGKSHFGTLFPNKSNKLKDMYEKCDYKLDPTVQLHQADEDTALCARIYFYLFKKVTCEYHVIPIPIEHKDVVKALGGKWNPGQRVWYMYSTDPFFSYVKKWFLSL